MTKMWFKPKKLGLGSGLPIAWEGWAVIGAFVAALGLLDWIAENHLTGLRQTLVFAGGAAALTILVLIIVHGRTEGGWRWRWGGDD